MPCRQQGRAISAFTLDISLPGATVVRQQAAWHWLRKDEAGAQLCTGHSPGATCVDIKEAIRLAVCAPLAEQLQCRHSPGLVTLPMTITMTIVCDHWPGSGSTNRPRCRCRCGCAHRAAVGAPPLCEGGRLPVRQLSAPRQAEEGPGAGAAAGSVTHHMTFLTGPQSLGIYTENTSTRGSCSRWQGGSSRSAV